MKVTQAIIPVAGLGTRFLPATKAQPKTMFPVFDTPVIQKIIEELVVAGVEEIVVITDRNNSSIIQHFSPHLSLEKLLKERGKIPELKIVKKLSSLANFHFIIQDEPKGDGHAILCAESYIDKNKPTFVMFGDDLVDNPNGENAAQQLLSIFKKQNSPVFLTTKISQENCSQYGIIDYLQNDSQDLEIKNIIEKPALGKAPSDLAIIGKYIITPQIWQELESISGKNLTEVRLTDAFISHLRTGGKIFSRKLLGKRFDTGDKLGFLLASNYFAMQKFPKEVEALWKDLISN
jgi:UTP--glucose-1-phosphate uridylyltransferase